MKTRSFITTALLGLSLTACRKENDLMLPVPQKGDHYSEKIMPDMRFPKSISENGRVVRSFTYNAGRLAGIIEKDGTSKSVFYDESGEVGTVEVNGPGLKKEVWAFNYNDHIEKTAMSKIVLSENDKKAFKDAEAIVTSAQLHGTPGRMINVMRFVQGDLQHGYKLLSSIWIKLDYDGRKISETELFAGDDASVVTSHFTYDELGRLQLLSHSINDRSIDAIKFESFAGGVSETAFLEPLKVMPFEIYQTGNPTQITTLKGSLHKSETRLYNLNGLQPIDIKVLDETDATALVKTIEYLPGIRHNVAINVNTDVK